MTVTGGTVSAIRLMLFGSFLAVISPCRVSYRFEIARTKGAFEGAIGGIGLLRSVWRTPEAALP